MVFSLFRRFFIDNKHGAISVELALIASAVFLSALPLTDIITRVYNSQQLASAVRASMQYAMTNPDDSAGIESVAQSNAGSLDTDEMTVTTTETCECNGITQTCGDSCAYGEQTYLTVSATYNQTLIMDYPAYGNEVPITRELSVRIE